MEAFFQTFFDWGEMREVLPTLLTEGIRNTLLIAVLAALLGLVIGMVLAMMLLSRRMLIRLPARIYVDIFRGLPAIVTISLIGLGLPAAQIRPFGRSPLESQREGRQVFHRLDASVLLRQGQEVPDGIIR